MTKEEKVQLKAAMEEKKEQLINQIEDLKIETKPLGLDSAVGRLSRMDYINNKSISEAGLRKAEENLRALERWLAIFDTDQFARCTRCGNEININRLLLMPASTRCINCAGK